MTTHGIHGNLIEVTVVSCNKLKDTEWISRQDPYVCVEYGRTKSRTRTCTDGGKNPTFQEKFVYTLIEGLRELIVNVWNSNTIKHDSFIGSGKVQLEKALSQGFDDSLWPLQSKTGRHAGEVRLIIHYTKANKPATSHVPAGQPHGAPQPYGSQYPPGEKRLKIAFEQPIIPAMDVYSMITINFNNTNMLSPTSSSSSPTSPATPLNRYESQKRRDWDTFRESLRNHRPQAKAKGGQPVIAVGVGLSTYDTAYVPTVESIDRTLRNFNSGKEPVLLQFWESTPSNSEDMGCNLMLTDQTFMSAPDVGLEEYRRRCLESPCRFVGLVTSVGDWLAGRAAQTGLADHRTIHHVLIHEDQHSVDIGNRGQLVLPVYHGNKLVGIIELVTSIRKESYVDYLEQIQQLLKDEGLTSGYMGKTIKVEFDSCLIRFPLTLLADITDLHREVKKRFPELEHQTFRVEYDDAEGNRLPISSGEDLRACLAESSLKGGRFIKMCVLLHA